MPSHVLDGAKSKESTLFASKGLNKGTQARPTISGVLGARQGHGSCISEEQGGRAACPHQHVA